MILFDQVRQFMHDHIVDHEHGGLDQPPVENHVVVGCAGTPAILAIADLGFLVVDPKISGSLVSCGTIKFM